MKLLLLAVAAVLGAQTAAAPLRGSASTENKDAPQIRGCIGPLYGESINWNAIAGWVKYHEERWGLTNVDIYVRKDEFPGAQRGFDSVPVDIQAKTNFTSLGTFPATDEMNIKNHLWLIKECLANAKANKADFLINFDSDEFLISDDFSNLTEMFEYADRPGVTFPLFQNNYHHCSKNEPNFGSATYQSIAPKNAKIAGPDGGYTDPPICVKGQRKYIVIPEHFDDLVGVHDPNGDFLPDHLDDKMFDMNGRLQSKQHARLLHYRTDVGIQADSSELLCDDVERCKFLSSDGKCVDDAREAEFQFASTSVNEILSELPLTRQAGALYNQAVCYAEQYPDLFSGFCQKDCSMCRYRGLQEHYNGGGKELHMMWGCKDREITPARSASYQLSTTDALGIAYQGLRDPLELHILLFETENQESAKMDMFAAKQSAEAGIKYDVIGEGEAFDGFATKWLAALPRLETIPPNALVVIGDSRDVLLNIHGNSTESSHRLVDKFTKAYRALTWNYPGAVVMAAEGQCCVSALTHVEPGDYFDALTGKRRSRACSSGKNGCLWAGDDMRVPWETFQEELAFERTGGDHQDVYLNAGLVAGRPADIIRLIETADMEATEDDQAVFTDLMYHHPESIVLDYAQEMFGNARWTLGMGEGGCPFDVDQEAPLGGLVHQETLNTPMFIHFPGQFWQCHDATARKLGIDSSKANTQSRKLTGDNYVPYRPECTPVRVDFNTAADGSDLSAGSYVGDEYEEYGLLLSAEGGYKTLPRLFDTANPGTIEYGDPDLGAPNYSCRNPGPGIGEGGKRGKLGENCKELGNVLIIQEDNDKKEIPDDNNEGGKITFTFLQETVVYAMALLDVDYKTDIVVTYMDGDDEKTDTISVPELGDNSYQVVDIHINRVIKVELVLERSAAVDYIDFCYQPPIKKCTEYTLDFEADASGNALSRGDYVSDDWSDFGLLLSSTGGYGTRPRIFDTANPGNFLYGDPDLGSPNYSCRNPGPGKGEGGKRGTVGENCKALGNVLIIQEDNDKKEIPDDNSEGGTIIFEFTLPAEVTRMGLLDVDYDTHLDIEYQKESGSTSQKIVVPQLGDNSYQEISITDLGYPVKKLVLTAERSAAIAFLEFCYYPEK